MEFQVEGLFDSHCIQFVPLVKKLFHSLVKVQFYLRSFQSDSRQVESNTTGKAKPYLLLCCGVSRINELKKQSLKSRSVGSSISNKVVNSTICASDFILSLKNNKIQGFHIEAFEGASISVLETSQYFLCCVISSETFCDFSIKFWFFSCASLLQSDTIIYVLLAMAIILAVTNVISFLSQHSANESFKFLVRVVVFMDFFGVVYMLVLVFADVYFGKSFIGHYFYWKTNSLCFTLSSLSLLVLFSSPILQVIVSLSRLMVVLHPFDSKFKRRKYNVKCVSVVLVLCVLLSIGITLVIRYVYVELPDSLCLPFVDPTKTVVVVQVITWVASIPQLVSPVCIVVMSVKTVHAAIESSQNTGRKN